MKITIDLDTENQADLAALAALVASLGGRAPEAAPAPVAGRPAPPPPQPLPASEQMIADAAANRSAPPPPPADEDPGTVADPTTLDKDGIPWDARIHAGTKTQNKDGTWKKLRGVDEVLYGRIHGELQAQYAGNSAGQPIGTTGSGTAPPPPQSATTQTAPPPPAEQGNGAPPPPADGAPTADPSAAATGAASATGGGRWPDFATFVQAVNAIRNPAIPYLELNTFAQTVGVAGGFKDMKDQPGLWETFYGLAGGQ